MYVGLSLAVFFLLLILGVPIVFSVGVSVITIWLQNPQIVTNPTYTFQAMTTSLDSFVLVAVPLFIFSGQIMAKGGIADKLFGFFSYFTGKSRSGLPITVIITCLFYGAISGSGPATAAAVGAMAIPVLTNLGYDLTFSASLIAVAGGLGVIIPPSIPMIMYGTATGASVGSLFIAGILPGFLIAACMIIYSIYYCRKNPPDMKKLEEQQQNLHSIGFLSNLKQSFLALLSPVIILGGIYSGIFTPTEAACISVVYALLVSLLAYRTLKISDIPHLMKESLDSIAPVLIIIGVSSVFGRALSLLNVTSDISSFIINNFPGKVAILLFINFLLLIIGCVMDTTPAILIFAPIFWPICESLGMDIVHFGIIMVVNLAVGFVTPPVGINLFVTSSITDVPVMKLAKKATPFIISFIIALLMITFIPAISLSL
ncbi:TRAP transporter large permease [Kallipyga massiliensis]|uniref:TRAP transporter large permease n=1 Tax=Kallipyga massiliensis TaxID=1472764 RepID=UPI00055515D4